jgi:polysaccharide biosynthesis/export protein
MTNHLQTPFRAAVLRHAAMASVTLTLAVLGFAPVTSALAAVAQVNSVSQAEYRLGAGDAIKIQVYQNPDLSLDARLSDAGQISYPLLGAIHLAGMTIHEAERSIAEGLRQGNFVKNPQVTILLTTARGSQVSVLGEVQRPGRYALESAQTHLTDMLANAGGIVPNDGSDVVTVVGTRDGQAFRQQVDLPKIFSTAERSGDLILQGGDVIYVDRAPKFFIYGEVQRPGQMRLERGMTLLQGLAAGGGLTMRGTQRGISIHRKTDQGVEILQPNMQAPLQNGDVIYVQESLF